VNSQKYEFEIKYKFSEKIFFEESG
jgi:hypothetical protein